METVNISSSWKRCPTPQNCGVRRHKDMSNCLSQSSPGARNRSSAALAPILPEIVSEPEWSIVEIVDPVDDQDGALVGVVCPECGHQLNREEWEDRYHGTDNLGCPGCQTYLEAGAPGIVRPTSTLVSQIEDPINQEWFHATSRQDWQRSVETGKFSTVHLGTWDAALDRMSSEYVDDYVVIKVKLSPESAIPHALYSDSDTNSKMDREDLCAAAGGDVDGVLYMNEYEAPGTASLIISTDAIDSTEIEYRSNS